MDLKVFQLLDFINNRLSNIEKNIARIDEKLDFSIALSRNHLIRIKNNEPLDDSMVLLGSPYNDLSPQRAYELYSNVDLDFMVLDVSAKEYKAPIALDSVVKIPLEELSVRYAEITNKTTPILVISEKGVRSIAACELMVKRGFFNMNNISGGYEFWPGRAEVAELASAFKTA